jgi:hypothetical protein
VAAAGRRFAFLIYRVEGEVDFADYHLRDAHATLRFIMVYDVASRHWDFSLEASKKKNRMQLPWGPFQAVKYALSPDGSLLGILDDGLVEVYRLPTSHP